MNLRSTVAAILLAVMFVASANAHMTGTVTGAPTEALVPGQTYTFDYESSYLCPELPLADFGDGDELIGSVANKGEYTWINASENTHTVSTSDCANADDPGYLKFPGTVDFSVSEVAPAFESFELIGGIIGQQNEGAEFNVTIAYNPAFTTPTALSFDAVAGGATATIPLVMAANADSTFNFDVTSFTIDGENVAGGATAHIQETLDVATGIATEEGTTTKNVELHFGFGSSDHGDHDGMAMGEEGDEMAMEGEDDAMDHGEHDDEASTDHVHWEAAEITVAITLAAQEDSTQVSEPQEVLLTIHNTDADTLPHEEGAHGDIHDDEGDDAFFLPGFGPIAGVAALGAAAVLVRRRD